VGDDGVVDRRVPRGTTSTALEDPWHPPLGSVPATPRPTSSSATPTDSLESFQAAGYAVLGVSPDSPAKLKAFREKEGLTFPLLSDPDKRMLSEWGAYGEKQSYGRTITGVIRSTFVVDPDGTIALAQYNVRATGHVAKLRRDLGL